jgi:hypothetical protein
MIRPQYTHIPTYGKIIVRSRLEEPQNTEWLEYRIAQLETLHVRLTDNLRQMTDSTERQMLQTYRRRITVEIRTRERQLQSLLFNHKNTVQ